MTKPEWAFAALIFGSSLQQIIPWRRLTRLAKRDKKAVEPPPVYRSVGRPYAKPPPLPPYVPKVPIAAAPSEPETVPPEEIFPLPSNPSPEVGWDEPLSTEVQVLEVLEPPTPVGATGLELEPEPDTEPEVWELEPELVANLPLETATTEIDVESEPAVVSEPEPAAQLQLQPAPEPVVSSFAEEPAPASAPEPELPRATHPTPMAKEGAAVPDGPPISMRALIAKMNAAARNQVPASTEIAEKPPEKG